MSSRRGKIKERCRKLPTLNQTESNIIFQARRPDKVHRQRMPCGAQPQNPTPSGTYTYTANVHFSAHIHPNRTPTYTFRRPAPKILHLSAPTPTPQPKPTLHRSNFGVYTPTLHVNLSAPTRAASQQTTHPCETCNEQLCLLQRPSQTRPDFADEIYYIVK